MKNTLFNVTRILAVIVMIGVLSMIGAGNPKALPFYVLFFVAVFAIIYLLNKNAKRNEREGKSGAGAKPMMQIIGVVLFVAIVSILGLLRHGVPGYIAMFIMFAAILALIFLGIKNRQRHFELMPSNPTLKKVFSIVMGILAIALPLLIIITSKLFPPAAMPIIITLVAILVFIALIVLALRLVNRRGDSGSVVAGYILVILAAILPGIMVLMVTKDSGAFAITYLAALVAAVLAYFTSNLIAPID